MALSTKEQKSITGAWEEVRASFNTGKTKTYAWRYAQLAALKLFFEENESQLKEALRVDLGRHPFEAIGLDILGTVLEIKYIMSHLKKWMEPTSTDVPLWMVPAWSKIVYEPFGVVLVLGAFNYPIALTLGPMIGAIAAGNSVVVKPSEMCTAVEKILIDTLPKYIDSSAIKVLSGGIPATTEILKLRWDKVFFTGSPRVGKIVMKAAAEHLTPVALELGGKSPTIIDESVSNLPLMVKRIMWGKGCNAGQTCIAPDYIFCHEKHYDAFLELAKKTLLEFYGPDPQKASDFGRIVTPQHVARLKGMIDEAGEKRVVVGGKVDEADRYVQPTILRDVSMTSKVMTEEIFGPILPVLKYRDVSDVIKHINHNEKPLTIYIYASNQRMINRVVNETSSGSVLINDCLYQFANHHAPFGGVGESGTGGYHGHFSFLCFSHQRPVLHRDTTSILDLPIRYPPYTDFGLRVFRFAMGLPFNQPRITRCMVVRAVVWCVSVAAATVIALKVMNKLD